MPPPPHDIYLARHGATEWSENGRHTGTTDIPLTANGEQEAERLGQLMRGVAFSAVYSSDLQRALRTAQIAGYLDPSLTPLLHEYDYGEYEGLTTAQIREVRPGWQIYVDDCPGGESPTAVYVRAGRALDLLAAHTGTVLAFSHGHFMRAMAVAWTSQPISAASALGLDTAALCILREGDHGRVIQLWNQVP
jgi:probable phosphoglycerate mutase